VSDEQYTKWTQNLGKRYRIRIDGFKDEAFFFVTEFNGKEATSEPYDFSVTMSRRKKDPVTPGDVMKKEARLTMCGFDKPHFIHGLIWDFKCVGETAEEQFIYRMKLVSHMKRLAEGQGYAPFGDDDVPLSIKDDIIEKILKKHQIPGGRLKVRWEIQGEAQQWLKRKYCCQYRQNDLSFVHNLIEKLGIFYHFEQEEEKVTLVFTDNGSSCPQIEGEPKSLPHLGPSSGGQGGESISGFDAGTRVYPGKVQLGARNFELDRHLRCNEAGKEHSEFEVCETGASFAQEDLGKFLTKLEAGRQASAAATVKAQSTSVRLVPGRALPVGNPEWPTPNIPPKEQYRIVSVTHHGSQGGAGSGPYHNEIEVLPAKTVFVPPVKTKRPQALGMFTGIVEGPSTGGGGQSEEIYTDKYGRIKVRFSFFPQDAPSCWVRVLHGTAGQGFGHMDIPRIGQEVVGAFIDSDPDRPFVIGSVYNGKQVVPYKLPDNKTVATIKHKSVNADGNNEIKFECKGGSEQIALHAEKDYDTVVKEGNQTTTVQKGNQTNTVKKGNQEIKVEEGNRKLEVKEKSEHKAKVIHIIAEDELVLKVGGSTITFTKGEISTDSQSVKIKGGIVRINDPG
jgi:type VI secretion system secreted protein VgrG